MKINKACLSFAIMALSIGGIVAQRAAAAPPATAPSAAGKAPRGNILLAGDGKQSLWLALPAKLSQMPGKAGFLLFEHTINQQAKGRAAWQSVTAQPLFGQPDRLTVIAGRDGSNRPASTAYVFFPGGQVWAYSADRQMFMPDLPRAAKPLAVASSTDGIFVLGRWSQPAAVATAPAKNISHVADAAVWRFDGSRWQPISALPPQLKKSLTGASSVSLVYAAGRLRIVWVRSHLALANASPVTAIGIASIDVFASLPQWHIAQPPAIVGNIKHLTAMRVEGRVLLLWPINEGGKPVRIAGGQLVGNFPTVLSNVFSPVNLGPQSIGLNVSRELTMAPEGSSVCAVFQAANGDVFQMAFDRQGHIVSKPAQIKSLAPRGLASPSFERFFLVVLALLLALSLWHRSQPGDRQWLAGGFAPASLLARALAALIDAAIPLIIVGLVRGMTNAWAWQHLGQQSIQALVQPEYLLQDPVLLWMLGSYVGYLTLAEWLFGRSIGKLFLRMEVVDLQGKPPGLLRVLIRNLIRIPELLGPALLLFVLLSADHRRLGDVLAGTVVVSESKPPAEDETPHE